MKPLTKELLAGVYLLGKDAQGEKHVEPYFSLVAKYRGECNHLAKKMGMWEAKRIKMETDEARRVMVLERSGISIVDDGHLG